MVTRIHKHVRGRLYPREHRKAKGLSAEMVAGRMGMERESLLRLERESATRMNPEKQHQYADAIGLTDPAQLWRPPSEAPSLDAMVAGAPDDVREMASDIVRRLVAKG